MGKERTSLNLIEKLGMLYHIARWRATWSRYDLDEKHQPDGNPKFMSAREAVKLIPDGAVVVTSGLAASGRCSIWFYAVKEEFQAGKRPRDLFWISAGAQGSRGRVPGTIEEIAIPGIMRTYCTAHWETAKAQMKLVDRGELEMQVLPQGTIALLIDAQARGEDSLLLDTAVGTFMDPRVGPGSQGIPGKGEQLIAAEGDKLRYRLPPVTVSAFVLPYADSEGNIYKDHCAMTTEAKPSALAARRNGGVVLASVSRIIDKDPGRIFIKAEDVDAVVVHSFNEQTGSVQQRRYWPMFTEGAQVDTDKALGKLRFANNVLKITPSRDAVDNALARLGGHIVAKNGFKGMYVNIGVGLPEEVARLIYEGGAHKDITFLTETGNLGGTPAMGIFFGAMVNPSKIISSAEMFRLTYERLDLTMLGMLQVDSEGNVNVSKRGEGAINYVGPGGFIDLTRAAGMILFAGKFMEGMEIELEAGSMKLKKPGAPKFVEKVDEITMNGRAMLELGKKIFYVTNVGAFQLTENGLELIMVFPGIDIQRDIVANSQARIVVPDTVPPCPPDVVTGENYRIVLGDKQHELYI